MFDVHASFCLGYVDVTASGPSPPALQSSVNSVSKILDPRAMIVPCNFLATRYTM
jgi:hypothetical protein